MIAKKICNAEYTERKKYKKKIIKLANPKKYPL